MMYWSISRGVATIDRGGCTGKTGLRIGIVSTGREVETRVEHLLCTFHAFLSVIHRRMST